MTSDMLLDLKSIVKEQFRAVLEKRIHRQKEKSGVVDQVW